MYIFIKPFVISFFAKFVFFLVLRGSEFYILSLVPLSF